MAGALLLEKGGTATRISYYHLMAFMASLPFNFFYSHIIFISFCLHTLINLNLGDIKFLFTWRNLVISSIFFITVVSTIYTINYQQAFTDLGRHIIIIMMPLVLSLLRFDLIRYRQRLLLGFALTCTAIIGYLYLDAFYKIRYYGLPFSAIMSSSFTNHNFADPIEMHATFLSLPVGIALVFMVSAVIKSTTHKFKALYILCSFLLLAGLVQLAAKSVTLAVLLLINIAVPLFVLQGKRRLRYIASGICLSLILISGVFSFRFLKTRYIAALRYDLSRTPRQALLDSRVDRWQVASELIKKKPVLGYGAGTELNLLHEEFYKRKYYSSFLNHLNVHNQYLSMLLKSGLLGLLIYLCTLWFGFREALRRNDLLFFSFMLMITAVSFSENFLDVDKGVIFYAFFFSFFMFSGDNQANKVFEN